MTNADEAMHAIHNALKSSFPSTPEARQDICNRLRAVCEHVYGKIVKSVEMTEDGIATVTLIAPRPHIVWAKFQVEPDITMLAFKDGPRAIYDVETAPPGTKDHDPATPCPQCDGPRYWSDYFTEKLTPICVACRARNGAARGKTSPA